MLHLRAAWCCLMTFITVSPAIATPPSSVAGDVLLAPWSGPYGGVPPFDRIRPEDFRPALETGMQSQLAEIEQIARNPEPATFDNTIAALERSGRGLNRAATIFSIYAATLSDEKVQAVEREVAPLLAAHSDAITQNSALYARISAVYAARTTSQLTAEQQRLAWVVYTTFTRSGARLDSHQKARLSDINQELAGLYTSFGQALLADEGERYVALTRPEDLEGLPASLQDALRAAAVARHLDAAGAVLNTRSSVEPFLEYSPRRELREKVWRMFVSRGDNGDAHDTNATIARILALRAQRAQLLGYPTHAHWRVEDTMAKTPDRAVGLMEAVWPAAVARVHEEVADMQSIADRQAEAAHQPHIRIEPWDYRFYAEIVRREKYDLDANAVKPYLQLEKLREGMFWVAGQLFGLHFDPVPSGTVPVAHPDIRVFEVTRDGHHVGLWYFDPYARTGKHSGAWMNEYRLQERFDGEVTTIVSNNANFIHGNDNDPVLISWEDAVTLFHEFGHALHGLNSNVTYPTLSGTSVARDYVEFPSQLLEHWLSTPEVLQRFAVHYQTGEPIPDALVAKIRAADTFNQGFKTVEYLSSALIDMKLHLLGDQPVDPRAFERDTLAALGMPHEIVMRHRTPQFAHVFSGDDYSAGYYSYLWSDTLSADAWEAFTEAGGAYDPVVAERLRREVLSVGNTVDPADAYRAFRGRDPGIAALMRKRGFPVPAGAH
jgi:peptidyl-dipeptidase Dcp